MPPIEIIERNDPTHWYVFKYPGESESFADILNRTVRDPDWLKARFDERPASLQATRGPGVVIVVSGDWYIIDCAAHAVVGDFVCLNGHHTFDPDMRIVYVAAE